MNKLAILSAVVLAVAMGTTAAQAQIREQQPTEFPPASYKGQQYVDSKGCVFIRAGIDGNVSWIPRVTRSRTTVCGFKPSLAPSQAATASAPRPAPAVQQFTVDPAAVAPAPVATPRVVRQTAPAAAPTPRVLRRAPQPPAQPRVAVAAPQPAVASTATRKVVRDIRQVPTACDGASTLSQGYLLATPRARCGAQVEPIISNPRQQRVAMGQVAPVANVNAHTRIVPKHVAINRINTQNVQVPKGYKPAWQDDRLNPKRAEQNLVGRRDMALIWTNTTPRRLIDRTSGKDMTATVPLVYPYLDLPTQNRELGQVIIVQRNGQLTKRIVRTAGSSQRVVRQPTISTRSAPTARQAKAAQPSRAIAGGRYVQIGTFRNPNNAQRTAQQLAQMGYGARIGKFRKGGKTYMTVQAGPFNNTGGLQTAVSRLRGAGYTGAFVRK